MRKNHAPDFVKVNCIYLSSSNLYLTMLIVKWQGSFYVAFTYFNTRIFTYFRTKRDLQILLMPPVKSCFLELITTLPVADLFTLINYGLNNSSAR